MRRLLDGQDLAVFISGDSPVEKATFEIRYILRTWHGGSGLVAKIEDLGWQGSTHLYHAGFLDGVDEGNVFAFVWGCPDGD